MNFRDDNPVEAISMYAKNCLFFNVSEKFIFNFFIEFYDVIEWNYLDEITWLYVKKLLKEEQHIPIKFSRRGIDYEL